MVPINAAFVFEAAQFLVDHPATRAKPVNMVIYVILKIYSFFEKNKQSKPIIEKLTTLYEILMLNCFVDSASLKIITQVIHDKFYRGQLTEPMLKTSYDLLGKASCQYRLTSKGYNGNLQPYLYFDGSAKVGFKVLLTNNRWPFSKGMHLCVWFKALMGSTSPTSPTRKSK